MCRFNACEYTNYSRIPEASMRLLATRITEEERRDALLFQLGRPRTIYPGAYVIRAYVKAAKELQW